MSKGREFTTAPSRAIGDTRLSALDLRCLLVIAMHDGMSTVKRSGPGCYAKSSTLAAMVQTDITNFSKAVSRLLKLGYIIKEPQQNDRRRFTLRVVYGAGDSWRGDQVSADSNHAEIVGESTNQCPEMVGEVTNESAEIVGEANVNNGGFPPFSDPHYISLNEELDFVETKELNSVETAQRENAQRWPVDNISGNGSAGSRKDTAEAGCSGEVSIASKLSRHFNNLSQDAQLSRFEEELNAIGRNIDALPRAERNRWTEWLLSLTDECSETPAGHRALRLWEELAGWNTDAPSELATADLRAWVKAAIDAIGYGGQVKLATEAGMPAPTLHGFRYGKSLPAQYRAGLQMACERALPFGEWRAAA